MATTFRGRLTVSLSALSICVLAVAAVLIYFGIRRALVHNVDELLLALARTEIASAFDEPGGLVHVHDEAPSALDLGSGLAYEKLTEILDASGAVVARTSNLDQDPPLELDRTFVARAVAGEAVFGNAARGGAPYRTIHLPLDAADGTRYAIVVAVSREPLDLTLNAIITVLATALAAAAGLAGFLASHISRRLTRPLERIAEAAQTVDEPTSERIPEVSNDREVRRLVRLLNEMLGRLESAFAIQRRFVADASHEMRSPLSNLRATIEVALRHPRSTGEYQATLAVALAEIERLARLVQGLLTLSRAGAGRLLIHQRVTDLDALAERALEVHGARAAARDVQLRLESDGPVSVIGDPDQLREVIDNLLDNALRMAPAGTTVRVRVRRQDGRSALEVEDHGPGLAPEEQAEVFAPFARGRGEPGDGAGLGLAIARAIAEAHGGALGLRSTPGAGATFTLELPASAGA